nr:sterol uptake control protein 2 [Quercus suber]
MPHTQGHTKSRAYHSKSRDGCAACKKRHIKERPSCSNCRTRRLQCPFQDDAAKEDTTLVEHGATGLTPSPSAVDHSSSNAPSVLQAGATDVCVVHLDLYHHFLFHVCPTFTGQAKYDESYRTLMTDAAFKHDFVLFAVLGLAALSKHMSSPSQTYRALAIAFQKKAIASLDDTLTEVNNENCVAVVLFAHLIGVHSFCDVFCSAANTTFHDFLAALIDSAQLLRGINSVMQPFWKHLETTEVGDFMREAISKRNRQVGRSGDETASLSAFVQNADIGESSRETYKDTVVRLQHSFTELHELDTSARASTHTAFAWLITSSPGYLQLLGEARPEALVIFAWYAVVLHQRRYGSLDADRESAVFQRSELPARLIDTPSARLISKIMVHACIGSSTVLEAGIQENLSFSIPIDASCHSCLSGIRAFRAQLGRTGIPIVPRVEVHPTTGVPAYAHCESDDHERSIESPPRPFVCQEIPVRSQAILDRSVNVPQADDATDHEDAGEDDLQAQAGQDDILADRSTVPYLGGGENPTSTSLDEKAEDVAPDEDLGQELDRDRGKRGGGGRDHQPTEIHVDGCREQNRREQDQRGLDGIDGHLIGVRVRVSPDAIAHDLD